MFFKLYTLGCKVNQYETEYLREGLLRLGYIESSEGDVADVVFLNTCAVTAESEAKGRKLVRRLIRENRGAEVIVFGCSARRDSSQFNQIEGITSVVTDIEWAANFLKNRGLRELPLGITSFSGRHRAYVKVQDGCRVGCSYCIIPKVRSVLRSRSVDDILSEIYCLASNGYCEIVLTGIHLGHYGADLIESELVDVNGCRNLSNLVERTIKVEGNFRLRLSSLEASEVSDDLINLMLNNSVKICPHLHLPMQSGSDEVLTRMRRRLTSGEYISRCERLLSLFDRLALTTDVIVGFPGETDIQFEKTCEMIRRLCFSKVHIFRYSPRRGTEAASFKDKIPPRITLDRVQYLSEIAEKLRIDYAKSFIGKQVSVLFETSQTGTTDRYLQVKTTSKHETGKLENIVIQKTQNDILLGE